MRAAENVVAGWLNVPIPPMPRQRRRPHHKTEIHRGPKTPNVRKTSTGTQLRLVDPPSTLSG